jgi:hypothetical protein
VLVHFAAKHSKDTLTRVSFQIRCESLGYYKEAVDQFWTTHIFTQSPLDALPRGLCDVDDAKMQLKPTPLEERLGTVLKHEDELMDYRIPVTITASREADSTTTQVQYVYASDSWQVERSHTREGRMNIIGIVRKLASKASREEEWIPGRYGWYRHPV